MNDGSKQQCLPHYCSYELSGLFQMLAFGFAHSLGCSSSVFTSAGATYALSTGSGEIAEVYSSSDLSSQNFL